MSLSRRSFIKDTVAFASLAVAGRAVYAEAKKRGVPEYYAASLARAADRVNALAARGMTGFWFLTDLHVTANARHSGDIVAALAAKTKIRRLLCGGDIPEAFGQKGLTDRETVDAAISAYFADWVEPCRAAGIAVYTAKGNHDFTVRHDPQSKVGFTHSLVKAREIVMGRATERGIVSNDADPTACYYYFDDSAAHVRYVVVDTCDTNASDAETTPWGVRYGIHDAQLIWLAEKALGAMPSGWGALVMHHIPVAPVVGDAGTARLFAPLRDLLEKYQNRGTFTVAGRQFDFSSTSGRILLDLTGHEHAERQTFINGVLHVTEPCDAYYGDYVNGSSPWCDKLPPKRRGTAFEHTFDAVQIDAAHDLVWFTRVGGGADRVIHLKPIEMRVGERRKINAALYGAGEELFWGCYDSDRLNFVPNPKNRYSPFVRYANERAAVEADGTIVAHKSGNAMVLARLPDGRKELFPVAIR